MEGRATATAVPRVQISMVCSVPHAAIVTSSASRIAHSISFRIIIFSPLLTFDIGHRLRCDEPRRRWALADAEVVTERCLSPIRPGG